MAASNTQSKGLTLLDRFLGQLMDYCKRVYGGHTVILHVSLHLQQPLSKECFTNVELNKYCLTGGNSVWTNLQRRRSQGEAVAATTSTTQGLDYRTSNCNQIYWTTKVDL